MKIRLFPTNKEKEILNTWFGMSRYIYNQSLISLKILTENNPLNDFYNATENPVKVNIDVNDNGIINLNISLNPLLDSKVNKCKFVSSSGDACNNNCSKNYYDFCSTHLKQKINCKFILLSGKNKGKKCGITCGNSGFCNKHSTENLKCKKIMKSGKNKGKECGKNCGGSDFCSIHSQIKREYISKGKNVCPYKFKKGKNKDRTCGKKCEGKFCDDHLKIIEKSKIKSLELDGINIRDFVRKVRIDDSKELFLDPKKSRQTLMKEFNEKGKAKYVYDESKEEIIWAPEWCPKDPKKSKCPKFPTKMFRGSINILSQDINSCISNGNYKLNMRVKTKKDKNHIINSDQWNGGKNTPFPSELSEMNGYYTIGHKRIPLDKLFKTLERRSYQILKDENNKYFLNLPVSNSFFYELKCKVKKIVHSENQTTDDRFDICALDSGIRTFQTLYGLNHIVEIGSNDCYKILKRLKIGDRSFGLKKRLIGKKIKNLVDDLHRKTISFLTSNYKIILLPNFGTSGMLGGKISKGTKREMQAFRFYNFKQRLIDKCAKTGTVLKIVSEAYTTQCCSECGVLTNPNDSKIFMCLNMNCPLFRVEIDRDFQGGRNVFIRNVSLAF